MGMVEIDIAKVESWDDAPDGPVVMLNLYRFKNAAAMTQYSTQISDVMGSTLAEVGAEVLYSGGVGPEFVAGGPVWRPS